MSFVPEICKLNFEKSKFSFEFVKIAMRRGIASGVMHELFYGRHSRLI